MNFDILSQERGQKSGSHYQDHVNCNMVAVIKDHNKTVQKPVCKDSRRESLFYLSLSHSVEVYIMSRTITGQYNRFLISYTGQCKGHLEMIFFGSYSKERPKSNFSCMFELNSNSQSECRALDKVINC